MGIFHWLETSPVVREFEVAEFREWASGYYYRVDVTLRDGSLLHAREFFNPEERHYSFHWQTAAGALIVRWDDAPHHRGLETFPLPRARGRYGKDELSRFPARSFGRD